MPPPYPAPLVPPPVRAGRRRRRVSNRPPRRPGGHPWGASAMLILVGVLGVTLTMFGLTHEFDPAASFSTSVVTR